MQNYCNETRNANYNTSDQGVISHSRAIKKKKQFNFCILIKLKATISIIVRVIGKNNVHDELHG